MSRAKQLVKKLSCSIDSGVPMTVADQIVLRQQIENLPCENAEHLYGRKRTRDSSQDATTSTASKDAKVKDARGRRGASTIETGEESKVDGKRHCGRGRRGVGVS